MSKFSRILLTIFITLFMPSCVYLSYQYAVKRIEEKSKDNYYTYAIIFYPDNKTTVEGYVDSFVWGNDITKVKINGEEYTTAPENVVIVKRKDLVVNKEEEE